MIVARATPVGLSEKFTNEHENFLSQIGWLADRLDGKGALSLSLSLSRLSDSIKLHSAQNKVCDPTDLGRAPASHDVMKT